jgi:hypothetical protein
MKSKQEYLETETTTQVARLKHRLIWIKLMTLKVTYE